MLRGGDEGFTRAHQGFNLSSPSTPAYVVEVADVGDVQTAVRFAAARGLPVAVTATGHQPSLPTDGGVVISTRNLDGFHVDGPNRRAVVQPAATWGPVVDAIADVGLTALAGGAATVGITGYTTGGGLSPVLGRSHGWASDHVRRFRIVTVDGALHEVTPEQNPELFWGVRGGKGNFGVVTELEFDLFDTPELYGGAALYALEDAPAVLRRWRDWARDVREDVNTSAALLRLPPTENVPETLRGRVVLALRVCVPASARAGAELVAPLRAVARPLVDGIAELPFDQFALIHTDRATPPTPSNGVVCWTNSPTTSSTRPWPRSTPPPPALPRCWRYGVWAGRWHGNPSEPAP